MTSAKKPKSDIPPTADSGVPITDTDTLRALTKAITTLTEKVADLDAYIKKTLKAGRF